MADQQPRGLLLAKGSSAAGWELWAKAYPRGVSLVLKSLADQREYGDQQRMMLSWPEWDRLKSWIELQRAEQRLR